MSRFSHAPAGLRVRTLVRRLPLDPDAFKPNRRPAAAKHLESTALERLWRNW